MDLGLAGRTAFVAAASRGIGRAIALEFAREGADVGICARDSAALAATAAELAEHGRGVVARAADVTDPAAVEAALAATTEASSGRLDCLVVNAGGPPPGGFGDFDDAAWRAATELTLLSAVGLVRSALPMLRRADGASVTFVSSVSIRQPIVGLMLSNSLRAAVAGLAKTLSRELAPTIRVNSVLPDRIRTARTEQLARHGAPDADLDQLLEERAASIPLRRYGDPAEFARVAVFLASPAASYVTGTALAVDGGCLSALP